jgi:hypothetical protein
MQPTGKDQQPMNTRPFHVYQPRFRGLARVVAVSLVVFLTVVAMGLFGLSADLVAWAVGTILLPNSGSNATIVQIMGE